jgi:hypothetical protein
MTCGRTSLKGWRGGVAEFYPTLLIPKKFEDENKNLVKYIFPTKYYSCILFSEVLSKDSIIHYTRTGINYGSC